MTAPKIAICIPASSTWRALFGADLAGLLLTEAHGLGAEAIKVISALGHLPSIRNELVGQALTTGASHILWLDTDMRFPREALSRLLAREQPIVGANYRSRNPPHRFTALTKARAVETGPDSSGLELVDSLGCGLLLVETEVFRRVPSPWFQFSYEGGRCIGEDVWFCRRARAQGYRAWIDHDLSKETRHLGTVELTASDTEITGRPPGPAAAGTRAREPEPPEAARSRE